MTVINQKGTKRVDLNEVNFNEESMPKKEEKVTLDAIMFDDCVVSVTGERVKAQELAEVLVQIVSERLKTEGVKVTHVDQGDIQ